MGGLERVDTWGPEALKVLTEWKSDLKWAEDSAQCVQETESLRYRNDGK